MAPAQGVCFLWRRKECNRGSKCKFLHDETSTEPCRSFQRTRHCQYGDKCRRGHIEPTSSQVSGHYLMRTPSNVPVAPARTAVAPTLTPLQSWRNLCRLRGPYIPPQMRNFLEGALKLINDGDIESVQWAIQDLADARNLEHIKQLLEADFSYDHTPVCLSFLLHVIPFLRIVTHPEFRGSIVLERYAGTIYNIMYGHLGVRGVNFFDKVLNRSRTLMGNDPELFLEVFPVAVSALRNTIQLNPGSLVQDDIKRVARNFLTQAAQQELLTNPEMRPLHKDFKIMNECLDLGEQIPSFIPQRRNQAPGSGLNKHEMLHPALQAVMRLPGNLSDLGPRHDNDCESITDIRILPTSEEIRCVESEYLPKKGLESFHTDRTKNLLDSQFRLLREDSIGCLRESLRQIISNRTNLSALQKGKKKKDGIKRFSTAGVGVFLHENALIEDVYFKTSQGLKIAVSFDQPVSNMNNRDRKAWWEYERVLSMGNLVCMLNEQNEAVFFTVSDRFVSYENVRAREGEGAKEKNKDLILTLAGDQNRAGIILSFADEVREKDIEWLYRLRSSRALSRNELIEFPRTLLASFRPILQELQKRFDKTQTIPFIDWLAPDPSIAFQQDGDDLSRVSVRPPPYAAKAGFSFDLDPISTEPTNRPVPLEPIRRNVNATDLLANTTLDDGQASSLINALSREIGLIQGPPGTGKTYVGTKIIKTLLTAKRAAALGPIICVCYTNHALDQFLEHLLDMDIKNIVRVGSRSKVERLETYQLRNLAQSVENTRAERAEIWKVRRRMEELADNAEDFCGKLAHASSEGAIRSHVELFYPYLHNSLFEETVDEEGFVTVRRSGKPFSAWCSEARYGPTRSGPREILSICVDPWRLNGAERYSVLEHWVAEIVETAMTELSAVTKEHKERSEELTSIRKETERRTLQSADIIGVTTTGLAMQADLLGRIRAKVLFCEEAGEILEAHTIITLIPSIEHMILIGDHEQLRPHIANYDLSVESRKGQAYALDVSLFEKLARQQYGNSSLAFPFASLNTQRRMHPNVADLIRLKTYPDLMDRVPEYQSIPGMKKRLFWMNHAHPDSKGDAVKLTTSYGNEFELDMVIALVTHLLHQGCFKEKQIAVLTPYLGQMSKLRRRLANSYDIVIGSRDQDALDAEDELGEEDREADSIGSVPQQVVRKSNLAAAVRIATVDNFQGEEADVVIVSLVRSNKERKCGFLKTSNRINVLLSRAKWGMYIIGNADTASSQSMWANVIQHLSLRDCIGNYLELECERHKDIPIHVASKEDFLIYAPEGGCNQRCEWRLPCGHACMTKCHSLALHNLVPCSEPCPKELKDCGHPCASKCGAPCAACRVPIKDVLLKCGHIVAEMKCTQFQHLDGYFCKNKVEKEVPGCKHKVRVECGTDVTRKEYRCSATCGVLLPCGHPCKWPCRECRKPSKTNASEIVVNHGNCSTACNRPFNTCAHSCPKRCHGDSDCGFCERQCEVSCAHSRCTNQCKDPCPPCAETCVLGCEHQKCVMPCGVSCNILPCDKLCSKILECGHPCPSICGEVCPDSKYCRECGSDEVLDFVVDMLLFETYRDARDEPIFFLPCGHYYTVSTFDGAVKMKDYFRFESDEGWKITERYSEEKTEPEPPKPELPKCPQCRNLVTTSARYNEVVKKAQLQTCMRRFTASSNEQLTSLRNGVDVQQSSLEDTRDQFIPRNYENFRPRYSELNKLLTKIKAFNKKVLTEEQPFHRVYELANSACRKYEIKRETYDPSVIQYRFGIEGAYQELRAKLLWAVDRDMIAAKANTTDELRDKIYRPLALEIRLIPNQCDKLIKIAKERIFRIVEIQARITKARFITLILKHKDEALDRLKAISEEEEDKMRNETMKDLDDCLDICESVPSCGRLKNDVEETILSFRRGTFYSVVTEKEMREVYAAMAANFMGTGHWYICPNGHQFTVGRCGMPMELGTCAECGAQIGGQNHEAVEGVEHVGADWERRMAGLQI